MCGVLCVGFCFGMGFSHDLSTVLTKMQQSCHGSASVKQKKGSVDLSIYMCSLKM